MECIEIPAVIARRILAETRRVGCLENFVFRHTNEELSALFGADPWGGKGVNWFCSRIQGPRTLCRRVFSSKGRRRHWEGSVDVKYWDETKAVLLLSCLSFLCRVPPISLQKGGVDWALFVWCNQAVSLSPNRPLLCPSIYTYSTLNLEPEILEQFTHGYKIRRLTDLWKMVSERLCYQIPEVDLDPIHQWVLRGVQFW